MRYILLNTPPEKVIEPTGKEVTVSLEVIMEEHCFNKSEWRQNEEWLAAWERLILIFETAFKTKAAYAAVEEKDYEKALPFVTLKGIQLAPYIARAITRQTACWLRASTKEPVLESAPAA